MQSGETVFSKESVQTPGYVEHIPYSKVPVKAEELSRCRKLVAALLAEVDPDQTMFALYMLHPLRIPQDLWRQQNLKFAVCWEWETGQSVRVVNLTQTEEAPESRKFMEKLAKAFPEQLASMPMEAGQARNINAEVSHLLQKSEDFDRFFPQRRWVSPLEAFLGNGACSVFLVRDKDAFFRLAKALTILKADPALGALDFSVPRFTLEDFSGASREAIENWMQLFEVYIAEDVESPGLLVASRRDLSPAITRIQALLERESVTISS